MFKQIKELIDSKVDGTFSTFGTPIKFETGYQVSFERPTDTYTDNEFDDIVSALTTGLQSRPFIGVWGGSKEISFHTDEFHLALMIALIYNQDAIWSWKRMEAIQVRR